jgi:hypothetical protein
VLNVKKGNIFMELAVKINVHRHRIVDLLTEITVIPTNIVPNAKKGKAMILNEDSVSKNVLLIHNTPVTIKQTNGAVLWNQLVDLEKMKIINV